VTGQVVEQRRLADAGLPVHHEHPALAAPDGVRQLLEHAAFGPATRELSYAPPRRYASGQVHGSTLSRRR
jgi:hypothetical protein